MRLALCSRDVELDAPTVSRPGARLQGASLPDPFGRDSHKLRAVDVGVAVVRLPNATTESPWTLGIPCIITRSAHEPLSPCGRPRGGVGRGSSEKDFWRLADHGQDYRHRPRYDEQRRRDHGGAR